MSIQTQSLMNADELVLNGLRVLAVDDDPDSLNVLAFVLEECGIQVTRVADATQALEIVAQIQPDLLILDIAMPGVDGYALLRQIRQLDTTSRKQIPAIALSAMATDDMRVRAMEVGFQIYLTKPFDIAQLLTAIVSLTGSDNCSSSGQ